MLLRVHKGCEAAARSCQIPCGACETLVKDWRKRIFPSCCLLHLWQGPAIAAGHLRPTVGGSVMFGTPQQKRGLERVSRSRPSVDGTEFPVKRYSWSTSTCTSNLGRGSYEFALEISGLGGLGALRKVRFPRFTMPGLRRVYYKETPR